MDRAAEKSLRNVRSSFATRFRRVGARLHSMQEFSPMAHLGNRQIASFPLFRQNPELHPGLSNDRRCSPLDGNAYACLP
jgi:hypothetical protein